MKTTENKEFQLDTAALAGAVLRRWWIILLSAALGCMMALLGASILLPPEYVADVTFRVSAGELEEARDLADSALVLLDTRQCLDPVLSAAGEDLTYAQLRRMLEAQVLNETEFLKVTVTGSSPRQALELAKAVAAALPRCFGEFTGAQLILVDDAALPAQPSGPDTGSIAFIGMALGLLLGLAAAMLPEIADAMKTRQRTQK